MDTRTTAEQPDYSLQAVLQELRDAGEIHFVDYSGTYRLARGLRLPSYWLKP